MYYFITLVEKDVKLIYVGGSSMKILLKRMDCKAELIEIEEFNLFCKQQFFEEPSSDGRLWIQVGDVFNHQTIVMYIGCNMQGNLGDEHFFLHRPNQFIEEMQNQMIYGNVIFAKVKPNEWVDEYVDMSEEEAEVISSCFEGEIPWGFGKIELLYFERIKENLEELYSRW